MRKHSPWWKIISFIFYPSPKIFFLSPLYPYFLSSFLPYSFPIPFIHPSCCHCSPCFFLPAFFTTCLSHSLSSFHYPFYTSFPSLLFLSHPFCLFYYCFPPASFIPCPHWNSLNCWMINTIGQMLTVITYSCIALCKAWAFSARCAVCLSADVHETCFCVYYLHTHIYTYMYAEWTV